jgi:hypothetical protein
MHKLVVAIAAVLAAAPFASRPAQAASLPASPALIDAAKAIDVTHNARCARAWRCGASGCGHRTVCWAPRHPAYRSHDYPRYGVYQPYSYFAGAYAEGYDRPHWGLPYWGWRYRWWYD